VEPGYTLIGRNASPYTRRVAVTLRLLEVPFAQLKHSPRRNPEDVRPYNPVGRVPVLVLPDGERLIESAAILDHLLEEHDLWARLLPRSGTPRRRAQQRLALAAAAMEKCIRARDEGLRPAERCCAAVQETLREQARAALGLLEETLADLPPIESEPDVTLDALTAAIAMTFTRDVQPAIHESLSWPRLAALTEKLEAMPAFRAQAPETG
jgi:glutathione S-transferase